MDDDTARTAAAPADLDLTDLDQASGLLADMRKRVDEAADDIERLTAELDDRRQALDELETVADAILGATATAVVIVGPDRRVRAVTRGAADLFGVEASPVGRPLSAVVPDEVLVATQDHLDDDGGPATPGTVTAGKWAVTVEGLEGGGAVLVVQDACSDG
jgi:nitrogen fixation/metabolism regulation signal transduction histidine kinase